MKYSHSKQLLCLKMTDDVVVSNPFSYFNSVTIFSTANVVQPYAFLLSVLTI